MPATTICTDRSPAAVANTLGIDLSADPKRKPRPRNDKPNVVIIIVDDLGYAGTSVYGGTGTVPTPNIDGIAAEGVKFTDGYAAAPVCSPSRAGLMTGRQPDTLGYANNLINASYHQYGLPLSAKTMADYFKEIGYITGMVGKWHLGDAEEYIPDKRGFDEYAFGRLLFIPYWGRYSIQHNLDQSILDYMESCKDEDKHLTDIQSLEATSFILRHRDKPFLLYFSTDAVHSPYLPKPENLMAHLAYWRHPGYVRHAFNWEKLAYLRMLMHLDEAIGRVLDTIDLLGLSENTLVWFFSDNGGPKETASNGELRSAKGALYEGGIRVPFLVRWPGTIPTVVHEWPITTLDVLPTSLAAAGFDSQNSSLSDMDLSGMNMLPYLQNKDQHPPVRNLYWNREFKRKRKLLGQAALRRGDWKLITRYRHSAIYKTELYNLKQDISEQQDLSLEEPEILTRLFKQTEAWVNALPEIVVAKPR